MRVQAINRKLCIVLVILLACLSSACRQASAPAQATPAATASAPAQAEFKVRTEIGFASRRKWLEHYEKHGREFGALTAEQYLRQAQTLRDFPVSSDVLEVTRAGGVRARFEHSSGAFLAFNADATIRTYFKPNDGVNYFWRQSRR